METALMRFNGFTFLCNPLSLEITSEENLADYSLLYSGQHKEYAGRQCRIVKGKGAFCGKDCVEQYAKLYALQIQGAKGLLSLPFIKPFEAFFTQLSVIADTTPDTINYSFRFDEADYENTEVTEIIHKVNQGETLFDIADKYKVEIDKLVKLNPWVRRPDELVINEEIKVC